MRRKTKQLLATGMTLAVLSSSALAALALSATKECGKVYGKIWDLKTCTQTATLQSVAKNDVGHTGTYKCPDGHETVKFEVHSYQTGWNEGSATADGTGTMYLTVTCAECGYELVNQAVTASNPTSHTDATCEEDATYTYAAGSFGVLGYTYDQEVTLKVPGSAKGHNYGEYAYNGDATCTKDGTMTRHCMNVNNGEWCTETQTVPDPNHTATGHSFTNYVYNNDATCTEDGTKTATCDHGCDEMDTKPAEGTKLEHSFTSYVYNKDATCTEDGTETATCDYGCGKEDTRTAENTATGHYYVPDSDPIWNAADKTVEFHFVCLDGDDEQTVTVPAVKSEQYSVAPTCTAAGKDVYTANAEYEFVYNGETMKVGAYSPYYEIVVPATGHHFGAYTCTANGTEVAACEYCGAADVRPAGAETVCDHHDVDGTDVCPVCGKVNGNALLPQITAASNANTKAITSGAQLVVRAGTLPTGQKVLTVAYLDANGKVLTLNGSWKVRVPVAQLKAALGDAEGTGFEHTLTTADAKQTVGYAVENGNVVFDAAFNGSTAFVLLVD